MRLEPMDCRTLGFIGVDLRSSAAHLSFFDFSVGPRRRADLAADKRRSTPIKQLIGKSALQLTTGGTNNGSEALSGR